MSKQQSLLSALGSAAAAAVGYKGKSAPSPATAAASSSPPAAGASATASSSPASAPAKPLNVIVYFARGDRDAVVGKIGNLLEHENIKYTSGADVRLIPRTGPVVVFCCSPDAYGAAKVRNPGAMFIVYKQTTDADNNRKGDNVFYYQWDLAADTRSVKGIIATHAAECAAAAKLRDVSRQLKRTMQKEKVHTTDQALQHLGIGPANATRVAELTAIRLRGMALAPGVDKFGGFNIASDDDTTAPVVCVVDVPTGFTMPNLFPGQVPPADIYLARSAKAEALWEQVPAWQKGGSNVYALPRGATDAQTRAIILVAARRLPFVPPSDKSLRDLTEDMGQLVVHLYPADEEEEEAAAE